MTVEWEQAWAGEQPIFKQYLQMKRLVDCRDLIGNVATEALIYAEDGKVRSYYTKKSYKEIQEDGKKLLDPQKAEKAIEDINSTVKHFWELARQIRSLTIEGENLHSEKLVNLVKQMNKSLLRVFARFLTTWEATSFYAEKELKDKLSWHYQSQEKLDEALIALVSPIEKDLLLKEKISWLEVLKQPSEDKVKEYMLEYPLLFCNIDSEKEAFAIPMNRIKGDSIKDFGEEIQTSLKKLESIKVKQREIFKQINDKEIEYLASLLQQFALLRLELKACWAGAHFYLFLFYARVAKASNSGIRDVMMFWLTEEIASFLETKVAPPRNEIERRKDFYLIMLENGKINLYSGDKGRMLKDEIFGKVSYEDVKEFMGSIANKGSAVGVVKLVRVDDLRLIEQIAKEAEEKFVLVTGMTNPNMMPLVRRAKAIVTDEGGITCHAAIISREFNIPCIIGTKIATQILKEGELVEVDADRGIVKKL